jgi:hypothetical protein
MSRKRIRGRSIRRKKQRRKRRSRYKNEGEETNSIYENERRGEKARQSGGDERQRRDTKTIGGKEHDGEE